MPAAHDSRPDAQAALAALCEAYSYPLYAYVRLRQAYADAGKVGETDRKKVHTWTSRVNVRNAEQNWRPTPPRVRAPRA